MHALEKLLGTPGEQKIKFKIFSGADQSPWTVNFDSLQRL